MKLVTSFTLFIILTMSATSFTYVPASPLRGERITTSEALAIHITEALKKESESVYLALFPSLEELIELMEKNSSFYSSYLDEARTDFENTYREHVVRSVEHAFRKVLDDGRKAGIEWQSIEYVGVEYPSASKQEDQTCLTLIIRSGKKNHRIRLEQMLTINGVLKVTQYISLQK